jgi:two-component system response regulator AtoC
VTSAQQKVEAETILAALNTTHWNRRTAAAMLKVDYKHLLYRMKKLELDDKRPSRSATEPLSSVERAPCGRAAAAFVTA